MSAGLISIVGGKLTTYRNLAEQTVDRIARILRIKLPECRTRDTQLPGAWGLEQAADRLAGIAALSEAGQQRLLSVYGGRALQLAELCATDSSLARSIDEDAFAIRNEFARTLTDIVFRRLMIGLNADQGRPVYDSIADLAAAEFDWTADERSRQLAELVAYSDSLLVGQRPGLR